MRGPLKSEPEGLAARQNLAERGGFGAAAQPFAAGPGRPLRAALANGSAVSSAPRPCGFESMRVPLKSEPEGLAAASDLAERGGFGAAAQPFAAGPGGPLRAALANGSAVSSAPRPCGFEFMRVPLKSEPEGLAAASDLAERGGFAGCCAAFRCEGLAALARCAGKRLRRFLSSAPLRVRIIRVPLKSEPEGLAARQNLAERGLNPLGRLRAQRFSRPPHSTALPSLRKR